MGIKEKGKSLLATTLGYSHLYARRKKEKRGLNSTTTGRAMTYIMAASLTAKCCAGTSDSAREVLQLRLLFLKIKWH